MAQAQNAMAKRDRLIEESAETRINRARVRDLAFFIQQKAKPDIVSLDDAVMLAEAIISELRRSKEITVEAIENRLRQAGRSPDKSESLARLIEM